MRAACGLGASQFKVVSGEFQMNMRMLLCGFLALLLAGCQLPKPDPEVQAVEREAYRAIHAGDNAALQQISGRELKTPEATGGMLQIRAMMPKGNPSSSKLIGWNLNTQIGKGSTALLHSEHDYGDRVVLAQTHLARNAEAGPWLVQGFHIQVATKAELAGNGFSLVGKKLHQYAFLLAALISPILMIVALVKVVRRKGLKRKWLWGILALLGLFQLQMNWSDGALNVQWITLQLIGFGVKSGLSRFDPWFVTMTLPVGALLILLGVWAKPTRESGNLKKVDEGLPHGS